MNKLDKLKERLREIKARQEINRDPEQDHMDAEHALMEYIGNKEVKDLYYDIDMWYA